MNSALHLSYKIIFISYCILNDLQISSNFHVFQNIYFSILARNFIFNEALQQVFHF